MIKLQNLDEKLEQVDVLLEDPNTGSPNPYYFDIMGFPEIVSVGKTKFLIGGSPYLKTASKIKIELKDFEGNVIYTEPIDAIFSEGEYRPVSIVVYDDDIGGQATLTILAELNTYDENGEEKSIPDMWKGLYNVRWSHTLLVDKTTNLNKEPVYFYRQPIIEASELISPYVSISGSILDSTYTHTSGALQIINQGPGGGGEGPPPNPDYNWVRVKSKNYTDPSTGLVVSASFTPALVGGVLTIPSHFSSGSFNGLVNDFTASIINPFSSIASHIF